MKVSKYIVVLVFCVCTWCIGQVSYAQMDSLFEKANTAYTEGHYQQAILLYDSLILMNTLPASTILYNAGNAYYKKGDIARSILYYERALKQAPSDPDILHNLKLANVKTIDQIEPLPQLFFVTWYYQLLALYAAHVWIVLSILFLWASLFAIACYLFFIQRAAFKTIARTKAIVFLCLSVLLLCLAILQHKHESSSDYAIIMETSVPVKHAPSDGSSDAFILHAGTKVELVEEVEHWFNIRLEDGNVGWVKRTSVEAI